MECVLVPALEPLAAVRVGGASARGGLPLQRLGLLVRAPVAKPKPPPPRPPPLPPPLGPPWDYTVSSVFVPRAKKSANWDLLDRLSLTDARSLHDDQGGAHAHGKYKYSFRSSTVVMLPEVIVYIL